MRHPWRSAAMRGPPVSLVLGYTIGLDNRTNMNVIQSRHVQMNCPAVFFFELVINRHQLYAFTPCGQPVPNIRSVVRIAFVDHSNHREMIVFSQYFIDQETVSKQADASHHRESLREQAASSQFRVPHECEDEARSLSCDLARVASPTRKPFAFRPA